MTDTDALTLNHLSSTDQADPEQVVDQFADRLMDELFDGVERALDGDIDALEAPAQTQTVDVESEVTPDIDLNFSEGGLPAVLMSDDTMTASIQLPGLLATAAPEAAASSGQRSWTKQWTMNRMLLGAAGLSLLATLGLWLHQRSPVAEVASAPAATEAPVVTAHAEFLEYLRRSLDVIAQQTGETTATSPGMSEVSVALNGNAIGLPPIGNNGLPSTATPGGVPNAGAINVIERVYIPYQTAQAPLPAGQPATSSYSTPDQASAAAPASIHTLVGILELGERSAALFEIDGVPQRVYIGERIGSSGWSLVSVANEEAMVRRNGEVRSIYIGQRF